METVNLWKPWSAIETEKDRSQMFLIAKKGEHPIAAWFNYTTGEYIWKQGPIPYIPEYYMLIPPFPVPKKVKCFLILGKAQRENHFSIWSTHYDKTEAITTFYNLKKNNLDCQFKIHETEWEE